MTHPICRVRDFRIVGPHTLHILFDDGSDRTIDFGPVLGGDLFGPLQDLTVFNQVQLDPEVYTLVWPNGADFDPATLHDWPIHADALARQARGWNPKPAYASTDSPQ
ncbi:MAG: DUF2442 domain-containing protein [Pirellulaceae bacterium]